MDSVIKINFINTLKFIIAAEDLQMGFLCKRCSSEFQVETNRELICADCNIQLNLLDKQLEVNGKRIKKLQEHKRSELEHPRSENPKI